MKRIRLRRRPARQKIVAALLASIFVVWGSTMTFAETGEQKVIVGKKHGVRMTVDSRWPDGPGYRPVRIRIEPFPSGPAPTERTFHLQIEPGYGYGSDGKVVVTEEITLEQGEPFVEQTIAVPWSASSYALDVSVSENDLWLDGLDYYSGNWYSSHDEWPDSATVLIVESKARPPLPGTSSTNQDITRLAMRCTPASLPTRWIDYSGIDLIVMSFADAKGMATSHPRRWRAIRDWLATGTTLRILGDLDSAQQRSEIDAFFSSSLLEKNRNDKQPPDHPTSAWEKADLEIFRAAPSESDGHAVSAGTITIYQRSLSLGTIQHVQMEVPSIKTPQTVDANWHSRHGPVTDDDDDYYAHMIPGVGLPPVNAFCILITLFVIVIGPVNYLMLRRRGRLYLLLATVPIASLLVTVSLFAYAFVSDGLGVRLRVRSYVHIDQRSGTAVAWSRQTYYAGMAPSGGLRFPDDTTVFQISPPYDRWRRRSRNLRVRWYDNQQHLERGAIKSRITAQLMVTSSRTTERRLEIQPAASSNGSPRITNRLGCHILRLLVCDAEGNLYAATEIAPDSPVEPIATTWADVSSIWRQDYRTNQAVSMGTAHALPSSVDKASAHYLALGERSSLERNLLFAMLADPASYAPQSYVAIVSDSPEVAIGVDNASQEGSFHLITGRW